MRDIEGIEGAMAILKPHWGEIEADFDRHNKSFLELNQADHDAIGRVLKSHLVIEAFLGGFLERTYGFEGLTDARLSFSQKAKLLPQKNASVAFVRPGILQLNKVRNNFGHDLNYKIVMQDVSAIEQVLSVARKSEKFDDPIKAIEAFAPIACAFLSVPPKGLQDLFISAFKGLETKDH